MRASFEEKCFCPTKPKTAAWLSLSAQIFSKVSASDHKPSHVLHSRSFISLIWSKSNRVSQRGQSPGFTSETACARTVFAPQCEQCRLPMNINPKHDGHAIVFKRERQNSHRVLSLETPAPQFGQFSDSIFIPNLNNVKRF